MLIATKDYLLILLFIFPFTIVGQEQCKVLVPEIAEQYIGKCKKGLANGKGVAIGVDRYEGTFKKGYPNGKGTYTWSTGEVYNGQWIEGQRHGVGTYSYTEEGKPAIMAGIWEENKYIGPEPKKPKVLASTSIERYNFTRQGDGNQITINFYLSGNNNIDMENFSAAVTSGSRFESPGKVGWESVTFPFTCKVSYNSWNKTHTNRVATRFEFQITQSGRWTLNLYNN